jgi:dihydropyrimidine dehydrogenase (NAD+) subunit PreT
MAQSLPLDRSESVFKDFKLPLSRDQAVAEANRCLFCTDAPCVNACPTRIDIPQFIRKIATGNIKGSARTIFDANILGMSCARVCPVEVLCVGSCVYNNMDSPPIQIGKLQRYSTDLAYENGWRYFEAGPDSGKSVGLIGAGPASLAAAHELRRFGHRCTIYEKRSAIGGLNTTGVAPYKMQADRALEESEWILAIGGIDLQTGVEVGRDLSFNLLETRHDAVFFAAGLGEDSKLDVPGKNLSGIHGAVEWIERMKLNRIELQSISSAVVIGGGNTALDAVRELRGLGIQHVTMLYRGTEETMSGYAHEWSAAKDEGVHALWSARPIAFEGDSKVQSVRFVKLDTDRNPIAGTDASIDADLVLLAIGQAKLGDLVSGLQGLTLEKGRILTDGQGRTDRPGFFAAGDCSNGGKEVVNAAAEGKAAAHAIHEYLSRAATEQSHA